jgi:membrane protein required for colicin V production
MPAASLVAVHAQKCQENANVLASPSSRHRAGKYDENVMDVNTFDVLLLVLVGLMVLLGVLRGLTRLLIGVGALVAAFMLAAQFHWQVAVSMARVVEMTEPVANLVAYLAIFLGTMLAGALVASALGRLLRASMLGWADRLAGGAVGLVTALLAAALVILPVVAYAPSGAAVLRNSVLAPYVTVVADIANPLVPDRLAGQYRDKMESLRQYWQRRRVASDQPPA